MELLIKLAGASIQYKNYLDSTLLHFLLCIWLTSIDISTIVIDLIFKYFNKMADTNCFCSDQAFWRSKTNPSTFAQVIKTLSLLFALAEIVNSNLHFWMVDYKTEDDKTIAVIVYVIIVFITLLIDYFFLIKENVKFVTVFTFLTILSLMYEIKEVVTWEDDWLGFTNIGLAVQSILNIIFGFCVILAASNAPPPSSSFNHVWTGNCCDFL